MPGGPATVKMRQLQIGRFSTNNVEGPMRRITLRLKPEATAQVAPRK
jgi:hypothetical protein